MTTVEFRGWLLEADDVATRAAYTASAASAGERCGCLHCKNFEAARELVYPRETLDLFHRLGIDVQQEAEVYHNARLGSGLHSYGGWLHFVGRIIGDAGAWSRITPTFQLWFRPGRDLALEAFKGLSLVQCELDVEVPWVLEEPYAE